MDVRNRDKEERTGQKDTDLYQDLHHEAPNYCISFHIAKFEMTFPYKATL